MSAHPTIVTLAILRQNLHLAKLTQDAATRRKHHRLAASEGERIAWLQRRIAELEAQQQGAARAETAPRQAAAV